MQPHVGVDHADQRHVGKVEALGDHLGAEQDVNQTAAEGGQHAGMAAGLRMVSLSMRPHDVAGEALLDLDSNFSVPSP